jgi:hypothetical protein
VWNTNLLQSYNSEEGEYVFGIIHEHVCGIVIPTSWHQSGSHQHHKLVLCHIRNDNNERNRKYISSSTRVWQKQYIKGRNYLDLSNCKTSQVIQFKYWYTIRFSNDVFGQQDCKNIHIICKCAFFAVYFCLTVGYCRPQRMFFGSTKLKKNWGKLGLEKS